MANSPETEAQWEQWLRRIVCQFPAYLYDDLMQEARLGLWEARQRYQTEGTAQFTTFARRYVVGNIFHYLRDKAKTIRVSCHGHEKGVRVSCVSNIAEIYGNAGRQGGMVLDYYEMVPPWETGSASLESTCLLRMQARQMQAALVVLTPRQRLFVLMAAQGYSIAEMGRIFDISRESASHSYHRAVRRMKPLLEQKGIYA